MAALNTLTLDQRQTLANSLQNAAALVYKNVQRSNVEYAADVTAQLAATKVLLDAAQG